MDKKVVAIDDIPSITKFIEIVLKKQNYQVYTANDSQEGYQKIVDIKPDIVISDVNMPDLSGVDIFNRVKKIPELAQIPFIFMTGTSDKVENIDYAAWLNKPFSEIELVSTVTEVLQNLNKNQKKKGKKPTLP